MALKRGLSSAGVQRNRASGSRFPVAILIFFSLLVPLIFFVGRGLHISGWSQECTSYPLDHDSQEVREDANRENQNDILSSPGAKVIDVIAANTNDMGPLSLDIFRKNNLSASWKVIGEKTSITDKINFTAVDARQETPKVKVDVSSGGDHAQLVDPAKLARRPLSAPNQLTLQFWENTAFGGKKMRMRTLIQQCA
ncbi:unnamed protein product [Prunus armeniaca]|uniref:Uncharacterized protein n=1 Tax=Prunus armeniaca TaxID=36596 RepID=A0A6J5WEM7_PRUAR|nr:unnamed protein product [Prunus armeniaca]